MTSYLHAYHTASVNQRPVIAKRLVKLHRFFYPNWKVPCPIEERITALPVSHLVRSYQIDLFVRTVGQLDFHSTIPGQFGCARLGALACQD